MVVEVYDPPCLTETGNKLFAVSGGVWIEVPLETTRDDLHKYMKVVPRKFKTVNSEQNTFYPKSNRQPKKKTVRKKKALQIKLF